jgi:hypothetical protein
MQIDIEGVPKVQKRLQGLRDPEQTRRVQKGLTVGGRVLQRVMRAEAPTKSGRLRKSISVRRGRERPSVVVGPKGVPYAHIVIGGARAHDIEPRDQGSVTFGGRHYELVHHPGVRRNPFPERAALKTSDRVAAAVLEEWVA